MPTIHVPTTVRIIVFALLAAGASAPCQAAILLYDQTSQYPNSFNALTSQSASSGGNYQAFDNFTLSSAATVVSVTFQGLYWDPRGTAFNPPAVPAPQDIRIGFFTNQNNLPGSLIGSFTTLDSFQSANVGTAGFGPDVNGQYDTVDVYNFAGNLHTSFAAAANTTYWMSIVSFASPNPPLWLWTSGTGGDAKSAQLQYGAANASYAARDRTFGLWDDVLTSLPTAPPPATPPTGTLGDVPEPGAFTLAALGLVCGAAVRFRRRK